MSREEDIQRWEEEATPLTQMRGVLTFDYNNLMVLVQAEVAEVAAALADLRGGRVVAAPTEAEFEASRRPCLVFRFKGHVWSYILERYLSRSAFGESEAQALSARLQTKALFYGVSDVSDALVYALFENGELIEQMETDEGFEISSFASQTHELTGDDLAELDIEEWVHQFFKDLDALEPGMRFMTLDARETAASMSDAYAALADDLAGWTYVLAE